MVTTPVAVHRDQTAPPARDRLASPGRVQTVPPLTPGSRRGRGPPEASADKPGKAEALADAQAADVTADFAEISTALRDTPRTAFAESVLRSRRRLRRRWPGVSAGLWSWRGPARRTPGQSRSPVIQLARTAGSPVCAPPSPPLPIVQLAATASRSLPAVASHAIGFAEPRPGAHSHGLWRRRGELSRLGRVLYPRVPGSSMQI
jgi:hypothetical protein